MSRLCQPPARAEYRKGKFDDWFWQFSIKGVNVNFLSSFQFISEILLACLPVSMGPCRSSWCIFSEYLKYTRINLMCIQFISKASIAGSYRREIFTVMSAYEHFSPNPPNFPCTVIIAIAGTISDSKFQNLERGSGGKITIWIEGNPLLRRIDGQIIVNKQKWVELQLQPFLTMAMLPFELGGEMWDWGEKKIWTNMERSQSKDAAERCTNFVLHCCPDNNQNGQKSCQV